MKKYIWAIGLIGASILTPGWANAADDDVAAITQATTIMTECAKIAQDIATVKVPKDHAKARLVKAHNEKVTDPKEKLPADPAQEQYAQGIENETKRLAACGKNYQGAIKEAEAAAQAAGEKHKDDKNAKVPPVFSQYQKAKEQLSQAIAVLSNDPQVSSYVDETLSTYFLK